MAERVLIARVRDDAANPGTLLVTAPRVGVAEGIPRPGLFLNPFARLTAFRILGVRHALRLPRDVQGRVVEACIPDAHTPVDYGAPLLRIDPRGGAGETAGPDGASAEGGASEQAGSGLIRVAATSEGIFYRRATPDFPPFVEVGSSVSAGVVLGLIEVMKCFNQITYGGPGLPERGEVVKILAADAAEVQFGEELFWVKPTA